MGERGMQIKSDNKGFSSWEEGEFPVACETCLGDNPYVRMTKEPHGKACKICERPYCVFRWRPGTNARFKSTQLCQTCAKMKNVCQVCILDLQYGLPVQVRDQVLAEGNAVAEVPMSDANLQWTVQQQQQIQASGAPNPFESAAPNAKLLRMARAQPYYRRNLPHKCSFYAKGECNRGDSCPFLHEMPTDKNDPLAHQNMKDRFYGKDDPVANKMLGRQANIPDLIAPADPLAKTLWVGNMTPTITEGDLRDAFYLYGEVANVRVLPAKSMAFVEFARRDSAEAAAKALHRALTIQGTHLRLNWASRREGDGSSSDASGTLMKDAYGNVYGPPIGTDLGANGVAGYVLPPPPGLPPNFAALAPTPQAPQAPGTTAIQQQQQQQQQPFAPPTVPAGVNVRAAHYPSMDPQRMGAAPKLVQQQKPVGAP